MDYETIRAKALELNAALNQLNALTKELLDAGVYVYAWWHDAYSDRADDVSGWRVRIRHDIIPEHEE